MTSEAEAAGTSVDSTVTNPVKESISHKGENSYYFAHAGKKDDLSQAQFIEGDKDRTMACMDGMKKLETEEIKDTPKVQWREDYSWADEKEKIKIYTDFPEGKLSHPEMKVEAHFEESSFKVVVHKAGGLDESIGVTNGEHKLSGKIVPEKCNWRVNSSKTRLVITLFKAEPEEGAWSKLKKHNISQHTGWN